eukprot:13648371-Alexandrium_andersonii.AAC.1
MALQMRIGANGEGARAGLAGEDAGLPTDAGFAPTAALGPMGGPGAVGRSACRRGAVWEKCRSLRGGLGKVPVAVG